MKKMYLGLSALVVAFLMSAFTPETDNRLTTVWFQDDDLNWVSEDLTPCISGPDPVCEITTLGYGTRRIYQTASTSNPFTKE